MLQSIAQAMQNPDRIAFSFGSVSVYWYGILMALGILVAVILANAEVKRKKMPKDTAIDLCLVTIPAGMIGARLYYVLFNFSFYRDNPIKMLYIWEGGLAIYGAVIGGLIGILIYALCKKTRLLKLFDVCAPGLVLAQAIGRWGNFFNQEAYGPIVTNPAHQWFPMAVFIEQTQQIHYATFFYESLWCLLIFLFLWLFLHKRAKHDGDVFFTYVLLYAFERMFIEGLRQDSLYIGTSSIRVSQVLSAALFVAVCAFFIVRAAKQRKEGRILWPSPEIAVEVAPNEISGSETTASQADKTAFADEPEKIETNDAAEQSEQDIHENEVSDPSDSDIAQKNE